MKESNASPYEKSLLEMKKVHQVAKGNEFINLTNHIFLMNEELVELMEVLVEEHVVKEHIV